MDHICWAPEHEVRVWVAHKTPSAPRLVWARAVSPRSREVLWYTRDGRAVGILAVFEEILPPEEKRAIETLAILRYNLGDLL